MNPQVNALLKKLDEAAQGWLNRLKEVGQILAELESLGWPLMAVYRRLRDKFGIFQTTAIVAMRWAKGEFGDDDDFVKTLIGKSRKSVLAHVSSEIVAEIQSNRKFTIATSDGRVQEKTFIQMDTEEVRKNLQPCGFVRVGEGQGNNSVARSFMASRFEVLENDPQRAIVAFISAGNGNTVRMKIKKALLRSAAETAGILELVSA